ncbi:MAG: hypothetical protein JXA11_12335, partial [Phycisphaerae bacterium]|nr:hypothetical protein [Phycisphaerae bacterium]
MNSSDFLFAQTQSDIPFERITIKGDKFHIGDKPVRFWGFNAVRGMNLTDEEYRKISERLKFLGVNLMRTNTIDVRHWNDGGPGGGLLPRREEDRQIDTTRRMVNVENFFKLLNVYRDNGIYYAVCLSMGRLLVPGDSAILETTPEDKQAWEKAIHAMRSSNFKHEHVMLPQFDERALALRKEFAG